ncbi:hypothetical protein N7G274_006666 [Stereocaulon virgatum]|uniref:Uncharacterized protein n=1 Tax=Stereocaulon virgatum TaxID=373712 RepID=A0ABR4A448_9LECA
MRKEPISPSTYLSTKDLATVSIATASCEAGQGILVQSSRLAVVHRCPIKVFDHSRIHFNPHLTRRIYITPTHSVNPHLTPSALQITQSQPPPHHSQPASHPSE